jgi:hypothetical protein
MDRTLLRQQLERRGRRLAFGTRPTATPSLALAIALLASY